MVGPNGVFVVQNYYFRFKAIHKSKTLISMLEIQADLDLVLPGAFIMNFLCYLFHWLAASYIMFLIICSCALVCIYESN